MCNENVPQHNYGTERLDALRFCTSNHDALDCSLCSFNISGLERACTKLGSGWGVDESCDRWID